MEVERRSGNERLLTYGAPYGRGVQMRCLRLRHCADGAQGVVQLGRGGNGIPGESPVFVISASVAPSASSAAAGVTATSGTISATSELTQELVFFFNTPFA